MRDNKIWGVMKWTELWICRIRISALVYCIRITIKPGPTRDSCRGSGICKVTGTRPCFISSFCGLFHFSEFLVPMVRVTQNWKQLPQCVFQNTVCFIPSDSMIREPVSFEFQSILFSLCEYFNSSSNSTTFIHEWKSFLKVTL